MKPTRRFRICLLLGLVVVSLTGQAFAGSIVGWGINDVGEATPPSGNNFIAIATGWHHSLALRSDGSIVGWGDNGDGEATPPSGNNFIAIAAGGFHSLALRSNGSIVGWGWNNSGQATPPAGNNFIAISAGRFHNLGLKAEQLRLTRFEINQCFQDVELDGTTQVCELIETKPFVVTITLERIKPGTTSAKVKLAVYNSSSGNQVGATKEQGKIIRHGSPEPVDLLFNDNETKDIKAGNYRFSVVVEDSGGDKLLDQNLIYRFRSSKTVRMLVAEFFQDQVQIGVWNPAYIKLTEQVFPVPKTTAWGVNRLEILPSINLNVSSLDSNKLLLQLQKQLNSHNNDHDVSPADFICAVVPDGTLGGMTAGIRAGQAILIKAQNETKYMLGHEIGHIHGLGEEYVESGLQKPDGLWPLNQRFEFGDDKKPGNPPPLKLTEDGPYLIIWEDHPQEGKRCDWADDTSSYAPPENDHPIFDRLGDFLGWGWWCTGRFVGEGGYDLENGEVSPSTFTMMSAATGKAPWISGPEYKSLRTVLDPTATKSTAKGLSTNTPLLSSNQNRMLISGIIDIPAKTAQLSPLIPIQNLDCTAESIDPNCQLLFISQLGATLGSFGFAPMESELPPDSHLKGPFCIVVDLPQGTARIEVTTEGIVVSELQLTDSIPTVVVLSPNGGEQIAGELLVNWSASDLDSNELSYTVEFSHDNGTEWKVLAIDHEVNELIVDTDYLPGGPNCLVKVIASDGWNRSEDTSNAPFTITTKPPRVTMLDPEDGAILVQSEGMQGRCTAYDPETGDVNDPNAIIWSSNIDGFLGKGNLVGFELSLGDHVLSATATDPEGKTATDSINVTVVANLADFNYDRRVNFLDLSKLSSRWQATCSEPNWCERTDLDHSEKVDFADLKKLAESWLWQAGWYSE